MVPIVLPGAKSRRELFSHITDRFFNNLALKRGKRPGNKVDFLTFSSLRSYIKIGITALAVLRHIVTAFNKRTCSSFCFIHSIPYFSSRHFLTILSDKKLIDIKQFSSFPVKYT